MIAMVVIQHPVKMHGISEWKSTSPAFIYLTSIALYSEMSAMKVSSVRRADFITIPFPNHFCASQMTPWLLVDHIEDYCDDDGFIFCHCQVRSFK